MYHIVENNLENESFNEEIPKRYKTSQNKIYIKIIVCFFLFFCLSMIYFTWLKNNNQELLEKHINNKNEILSQMEDLKKNHLEEILKLEDKYKNEKKLLEGIYLNEKNQIEDKHLNEKKLLEDKYLKEKEILIYQNLKDKYNFQMEIQKHNVEEKVVVLEINKLRKELGIASNLSKSGINSSLYQIIEKYSKRKKKSFEDGTLIHLKGKNLPEKLQNIKNRNSRLMVKNHSDQIKNIKIPPPCQDGIDVVLTWVNGSDPLWLEKIKKYYPKFNPNNGRYRDQNSLMYSIRSVYEYAPYIKNYYLVTDNQTPSFLNTSNLEFQDYKFTVIDHKDIFLNKSDLPVFNSNAIEANIHRIKGLKKCFLYLNDDLLLSNYEHPNYFIENNKIKVRLEGLFRAPTFTRQHPNHIWFQLMENTNNKINKILKLPNDTEHYFPCHNFQFLDRDIIYEYQEQLKEEYLSFTKNKRRSMNDIEMQYSFSIYNSEKYKAPKTDCGKEIFYFPYVNDSKKNDIMIQELLYSNASCVCVNDNAPINKNMDDEFLKLNIALEMKYPYPSPFEKKEFL